ncbi:hypothetical protein Taro_003009 [Colocasia esculenta]|uniref:Uncharacterized protein n=1 Tax=Colocasia esculenta TaxID=4460 RepID=A0A843TFR8_COLES|nr:hypothetical protein [Colocasia esculenta]
MTSMEHSPTTPPKKVGTQCTTTNHYPHWVQVPTTTRYHHRNHKHTMARQTPVSTVSTPRHTSTSKTLTSESHTHEPQPVVKHESESTTPPHENRLLVHDANIQLGQHNTRTTSQSRSHRRKVQLLLHNHKPKNSGDQPTPQPAGHTPRKPMPGTFRDSSPRSLK